MEKVFSDFHVFLVSELRKVGNPVEAQLELELEFPEFQACR